MAQHLTGSPGGPSLASDPTLTPQARVGLARRDTRGGSYIYVGASGVPLGAPLKVGSGTDRLSTCVVGGASTDAVLGVAAQEFPVDNFYYGWVGVQGVQSTKVPSGTAAGTRVCPGNGTATTVPAPSGTAAPGVTKTGITLATAANDGSAVDVYWF